MSTSSPRAEARAAIDRIIAAELGRRVAPPVDLLVDRLRQRHGERIAGILFYGSCLRTGDCRGMFDFYVIAESYRDFYGRWGLAALNAVLPPNVVCLTVETASGPVLAKVAVVSRRQFVRAMRRTSLQTSFWARFCQPAALVYARDQHAAGCIRGALVEAVVTAAFWAARLGHGATSPQRFWSDLFRSTYGTELRAERPEQPTAIYKADPERYDALMRPALLAAGIPRFGPLPPAQQARARRTWRLRCVIGKALSLLRLIKAAYTFEGGVDYLCWKIGRHSGVAPSLTMWQRRHPILAGPALAWRLYRQGAFR
jgi:hypothetical protein